MCVSSIILAWLIFLDVEVCDVFLAWLRPNPILFVG